MKEGKGKMTPGKDAARIPSRQRRGGEGAPNFGYKCAKKGGNSGEGKGGNVRDRKRSSNNSDFRRYIHIFLDRQQGGRGMRGDRNPETRGFGSGFVRRIPEKKPRAPPSVVATKERGGRGGGAVPSKPSRFFPSKLIKVVAGDHVLKFVGRREGEGGKERNLQKFNPMSPYGEKKKPSERAKCNRSEDRMCIRRRVP